MKGLTFLLLSFLLFLLLHSFGLLVVGCVPAAPSLSLRLVLRVRKLFLAGYPFVVSPD